jgi:hypothetical protein
VKHVINLSFLITSTFNSLYTFSTENLQQGLMNVNGSALYYQSTGQSAPTVVIEARLGMAISAESQTSWDGF